jgi:hypothetical protein
MIAVRDHNVAFIVMMAGSGVPGDQVIATQTGCSPYRYHGDVSCPTAAPICASGICPASLSRELFAGTRRPWRTSPSPERISPCPKSTHGQSDKNGTCLIFGVISGSESSTAM